MKRDQQKAIFAKLGNGARVESLKKVGGHLGDIPKGTQGTVVDHFGSKKRPIVKFDGHRTIVSDADELKLLKGSKVFEFKSIISKGSAQQLKKRILENGFSFTNGGGNWVGGSEYLDDGEGRQADIPFSVELKKNRATVHVRKGDIPHRWQFMADDVIESINEKVSSALER